MVYKAAIFDAFGTIIQIKSGVHPYRQVIKEGIRQGRRPQADDAHVLLTLNLSLPEAAEHLGIKIAAARLSEIEDALEGEISAIEAYPDALEAIALLQAHHVLVGVCSNLAAPYGAAVKRLFPKLDAYAFSYELGVIKPNPTIYQAACQMLGGVPGNIFGSERVVMIGDSLRCDCHGPREVGIIGVHLDRSGLGRVSNLIDFANHVINSEG